MAIFKNWPVEKQGGLGSLFPGKGGERIKPRPQTRRPLREFIGEPIPFRPTIPAETEPGGPRLPRRPPGESVMDKVRALRAQIQQLNAQIQSLLGGRKRWMDDLDFGPGGEPPMPVLPRPPRGIPIGPPTMPVPTIPIGPPSIGPGTPIPQPPRSPPTPWQPDPPWGG